MKNFRPGDIARVEVDYDIDPGVWMSAGVSDEEVSCLLDSIGTLVLIHEVGPEWATVIARGNTRVRWVPNAYLKFVCGL